MGRRTLARWIVLSLAVHAGLALWLRSSVLTAGILESNPGSVAVRVAIAAPPRDAPPQAAPPVPTSNVATSNVATPPVATPPVATPPVATPPEVAPTEPPPPEPPPVAPKPTPMPKPEQVAVAKPEPVPPPEPPPEPLAPVSSPPPEPPPEPVSELASVEAPSGAPDPTANAEVSESGDTEVAPEGRPLEDELARYTETLWKLISAHKKYPAIARRRGIEGSVRLQLAIDASGELTGLETADGVPMVLGRQARSAADRAAPFPPPPGGDLRIEFVLEYDLDD